LSGNEGKMDGMGFIKEFESDGRGRQEDISQNQIFTRISPEMNIGTKRNTKHLELRVNSNCWICEGWSEYKFEFVPPEKIDAVIVPVRIHLSTDDYEGEILEMDLQRSALESAGKY
jgi:hypothetical protein